MTNVSTSGPATVATFSGLASGIDTSGIITKLTAFAQKPIKALTAQDDALNGKLKAWQSFSAQVVGLQASLTTLSIGTTYNAASGTSSNTTAASLTVQPGATRGDHSLTVNQLAQTQKLVSSDFTSNTSSLNETGSFAINGKTVALVATDTLADIATKINKAQAGVTAAIVNVGANDYRLTLASNGSGTVNAISASDISGGTALADIGLVTSGAATAARQQLAFTRGTTNYAGAASLALTSGSTAVATALGYTGTAPAGSFTINGTSITADLASDSLDTVASKINAANITGVSAQVVAVNDIYGNPTKRQLQIVGGATAPAAATPPAFSDPNGMLTTLGVVQGAFTNPPVAAAADAKFNLDGIDYVRSNNTVSDVLAGASFKLATAGTVAAPQTTALSISSNTTTAVGAINTFVSAYNAIADYVKQQNAYTPPTGSTSGTATTSPPLFGDATLNNIQDTLNRTLGISSSQGTLGDIGITLDTNGHLNVDTGTLTTALTNNSAKVQAMFGTSGSADNQNVQYVSATTSTVQSTSSGYGINISHAATQSTIVASTPQTGRSTAPETLSFSGSGFIGAQSMTLSAGNSLQDTVNQINGNSDINGLISASIDPATGALQLASKSFGAGHTFIVSSNTAASATSSGLGTSTTSSDGVDVQGTINGESAVGTGQLLTAASTNKNTAGIQIKYTGTGTGNFGHLAVTHGVADALNQAITQILDPTSGAIYGATSNLNTQISDKEKEITDANNQVSTYTAYLQQMFSAMETRVSKLQSQGAAFAAQANNLNSSNSKN